jgi:hypothetical protein
MVQIKYRGGKRKLPDSLSKALTQIQWTAINYALADAENSANAQAWYGGKKNCASFSSHYLPVSFLLTFFSLLWK